MGKKKSTVKFLKKGLHKVHKEAKQKNAWRSELKAKRAGQIKQRVDDDDLLKDEFVEPDTLRPREEIERVQQLLKDMSADQFLSGGFKHHLINNNDNDDDANNDDNDDDDDDDDDSVREFGADDAGDVARHTDDDDAEHDNDEEDDEDGLVEPNVRSAVRQHKQQLANLAQTDPKFFKFLQANDQSLLAFGGDDETETEAADDDDDGDDAAHGDDAFRDDDAAAAAADDDGDGAPRVVAKGKLPELTVAMVQRWSASVFEPHAPLAALSKLVSAFKAAVLISLPESPAAPAFAMHSPQALDAIMAFCLDRLDAAFAHFLDARDPPAPKKPKAASDDNAVGPLPHERTGWKQLEARVRVYLSFLVKLLSVAVEDDVCEAVTQHLERLVPYMYSFPKICKHALPALTVVWSARSAAARMRAFLCILRMAQELPYPFVELCLKQTYLAFVRSARTVTTRTLSHAQFMRNCIVELCGIDFESTYQMAFVYLRQLALHLRTAFIKRTQAATNNVTSWQYFLSLSVWAQMLKQFPGNEELQHLVYPVTQIIGGLVTVSKSPRFYPLRFQLCRLLNDIARASGGRVYVNAAPFALEALQCKEMLTEVRKLRPGNESAAVFYGYAARLHLPKAALETRQFQTAVLDQVEEIVIGALCAVGQSIALPDVAVPILAELRRFKKATPNAPHRHIAAALMQRIDDAIAIVDQLRNSRRVTFAPKNVDKANAYLLSAGVPNPFTAHADALSKRIAMRETALARVDESGRSSGRNRGGGGDDDDDDNGDDDSSDGTNGFGDDADDDGDNDDAPPPRSAKAGTKRAAPQKAAAKKRNVDPLADDGDDLLKQFDLDKFSEDDATEDDN
jgi:nucleolar complex protein 2